MGKQQYSKYQADAIGRYYKNLEGISLQNLQELVTELYLAESAKKKEQLWGRVEKSLDKLKIPKSRYKHILEKRSVEILAKNLAEWLKIQG